MKVLFRVLLPALVAFGVLAGPASAQITEDQSRKAFEIFESPNQAVNSDLAFWGEHAFIGYYTGDAGVPAGSPPRGGVRIFDISNPARPELVKDLQCDGLQADPIVWDRNGNGVADLLLVAVDRTMEGPDCGDLRSNTPEGCQDMGVPGDGCGANHSDPDGWEGVRVFEMSDDPRDPFETIEQVKAVYTDCGAHTITAWPGEIEETGNLLVYVSSYPLRGGPTCGDTEYLNEANEFDEDPGSPDNPLHGVIQIVEVPLDNPAASREADVQPEISYRTDPDEKIDWCERGEAFGFCQIPAFEPGAVACHDIVVHVEHRMAGAACAEDGQVWEIDEDGIPDTENPMSTGDDELTSGGEGQFPGAVDFFHSVMFDNEGETVNWVDESFGSGCPTMTTYQSRPWNLAGGTHKTGKMFFSDLEGNFQSEFHVGDLRPDSTLDEEGNELEYCSSHMGMAVMGIERDLLVNAWYTGGMDVIDFTNPTRLKEIAYYDPARVTGTWSAYPYTGPLFKRGPGKVPIYTSDGVEDPPNALGMVVYRVKGIPRPGRKGLVDHLNPQTMDHEMDMGKGHGKGKGKGRGHGKGRWDDDRGKGRGDDHGKGWGRGREDDDDDDGGWTPPGHRGDDDDDDDRGWSPGNSGDDDDDDDDRGGGGHDDDDDKGNGKDKGDRRGPPR
jgi:hypothetical protein